MCDNLKCLGWNCRGVSGFDKLNRIRRLIGTLQLDLVALVETRADENRVARFCSKFAKNWNWAAVAAEGYSGGIIVLWQKRIGFVTPLIHSRRALHLIISSSSNVHWLLTVVYNAQRLSLQRDLWRELAQFARIDCPWIIFGDFNSITSSTEHLGGNFNYYARKAYLFSNFISGNSLVDVNYVGSNFSWCNGQHGRARRWARLDRCLVNACWFDTFNSIHLSYLPKIFSDHSPMMITIAFTSASRCKLFRFENFWLEHGNFIFAIRQAISFKPHSSPMHAFYHILARVRHNVNLIKHQGLGALDQEIKFVESQLQALDVDVTSNPFYESDQVRALQHKYRALLRQNHCRWAQRSRLNWIIDGDMNSTFFHKSVRIRRHNNLISSLLDSEGNLVSDLSQINETFINHFTSLWNNTGSRSFDQILDSIPNDLPCLDDNHIRSLTAEVTRDEIFNTIKSLPSGKSPGPDGMNAEFYKFFMDDLSDLLLNAIKYFFSHAVMPKAWGKTFIVLIPKKEHPKFVSDFRPISLCNVAYKIVTKILANRLKGVIGHLIGREQCGFIPGRSPLDNIIAAQEIFHSINSDRSYPPRMVIKVDIEKAYDTLNWDSILATMTKMNFPNLWISYIKACLNSTSFSILVNGRPTDWISPKRGVRQGDPLSPYLFILVAQNLTLMLNFANRHGFIPGFSSSLRYNFNHLMYADDLILITTASRKSARNIKLCLDFYHHISG